MYSCRVEISELSKYGIIKFDPGVLPFALLFPEDTDLEKHPQEKKTQLSWHLFLSAHVPSQHLCEITSARQPQVQLRFTLAHLWLPHQEANHLTWATIVDLFTQIYSSPLIAQQRTAAEDHTARASARHSQDRSERQKCHCKAGCASEAEPTPYTRTTRPAGLWCPEPSCCNNGRLPDCSAFLITAQ